MKTALLALFGALAAASIAAAQPVGPPPGAVSEGIDWARRPTAEDLERVYPSRARGQTGRAVLQCTATGEGNLESCTVMSEDPPNVGFGLAALKLIPKFQLTPTTRAGASIEGAKITIPIVFRGRD